MKKLFSVLLVLSLLAVSGCAAAPVQKDVSSSVPASSTVSAQEAAVSSSSQPVEEAVADGNMIKNGDFGKLRDWFTYEMDGSSDNALADGELEVSIKSVGTVEHGVQIYQDISAVDQGCKYSLSFDAHATAARTADIRIQMNGGDYKGYLDQEVAITTEKKHYDLELTMADPSDPAPRFAINLGKFEKDAELGAHKVYFDNISLKLMDSSGKTSSGASNMKAMLININQLGYRINDKKVAVFSGEDTKFEVVDTKTNKTVFTGDITGAVQNSATGETNRYGDFSSITTPGTYLIKTAKLGDSFPFTVDDKVYDTALKEALNMFYCQRCGTKLSGDKAGVWAHEACHTQTATIFGTDKKLEVSGGWHDAGDYGRYTVASAKAAADLMLAWQLNPASMANPAVSSIPGVVDEVRYNLEWMLKMQDTASGGIYHKVTNAVFEKEVMPDKVTDPLIVSPISSTATGDFAAVMAMASGVYKPYDAKFAEKCLAAAEKAWKYVKANPQQYFKNPEGIVTGEYGDTNTTDELYWAACELFKATGKAEYNDYVKEACKSAIPEGLGWLNVGTYGSYAYLTAEKADKDIADTIKAALVKSCDALLKQAKNDGYGISIGTDYVWGSNMLVANNAIQLLITDKLAPNSGYREAAENHLHYLLGRNSVSYCFVTGLGAQYPGNPHHRPSLAAGKTIPGMLVGGPNSALEDPYAKAVLKGLPPAKCYADNSQSYSTNEVDIYWNSPFVFLLSYYAKAY